MQITRMQKEFIMKKLGNNHDMYVAKFLSAPGLVWKIALKKTKIKLDLLTDIGLILMVEKCIREMCHSIYWYAKANNKYMKDYDKIKNLHIFSIGMLII